MIVSSDRLSVCPFVCCCLSLLRIYVYQLVTFYHLIMSFIFMGLELSLNEWMRTAQLAQWATMAHTVVTYAAYRSRLAWQNWSALGSMGLHSLPTIRALLNTLITSVACLTVHILYYVKNIHDSHDYLHWHRWPVLMEFILPLIACHCVSLLFILCLYVFSWRINCFCVCVCWNSFTHYHTRWLMADCFPVTLSHEPYTPNSKWI